MREKYDHAGIRNWQSRSAQNVCLHPCHALAVRFFSPSLPGRPLKYGGESSSLSITQSLFLPRWRAKKSSALTAGIPYGPYPWPCSQAQHVLMDKCPERIRVFLSRFSAPVFPYRLCCLCFVRMRDCTQLLQWKSADHTSGECGGERSQRMKVVTEETAQFDRYIKTLESMNTKADTIVKLNFV